MEAHLLAGAVDRLEVANWQRSADGEQGVNKPTQIPRPGLGSVPGPRAAAIRAKARAFRARRRKRDR